MSRSKISQRTSGVGRRVGWCWTSVNDNGPTLAQHWDNASRLLGLHLQTTWIKQRTTARYCVVIILCSSIVKQKLTFHQQDQKAMWARNHCTQDHKIALADHVNKAAYHRPLLRCYNITFLYSQTKIAISSARSKGNVGPQSLHTRLICFSNMVFHLKK